jgi:hypothetical protein
MSNLPYVEIYLGNLGGRGAPAEEFGAFLQAANALLEAIGSRLVEPRMAAFMVEPTMPVAPERAGHELAVALTLDDSGGPIEATLVARRREVQR